MTFTQPLAETSHLLHCLTTALYIRQNTSAQQAKCVTYIPLL